MSKPCDKCVFSCQTEYERKGCPYPDDDPLYVKKEFCKLCRHLYITITYEKTGRIESTCPNMGCPNSKRKMRTEADRKLEPWETFNS